ncbi:Outer membrane protein assembly factor BamB [bacterium HR36]|nr:Outer membrane protein assembly factor BamB [bacterium HR36]
MRRISLLALLAAIWGLVLESLGQISSRDPAAALSPLGLVPVWSVPLPRSDPRQEALFVQLLDADLLLVQMRSGTALAFDAVTGNLRWLVQLGPNFRVYQRPAIASQLLVVIPVDLSLDVYERKSGVRLWRVELNNIAHRAPACDDSHLVVLDGEDRVRCWLLPHVERYLASQAADRPPATNKPLAPSVNPSRSLYDAGVSSYEIRRQLIREPQRAWDFQDSAGFDLPALTATDQCVAFVSREGKLRLVASDQVRLVGEWQFPKPLSAPMGFFLVERTNQQVTSWEPWLIAPCSDNALYAFRIHQGKLTPVWQRVLGDEANAAPILLGNRVFVAAASRGLFCLERDTGRVQWQQLEAREFIATSPRLVFALDQDRRLMVLERESGAVLGRAAGNSQWRAVANQFTDRVYLLSGDGRLYCFRDRAPECREPQIYYRLRFAPPAVQLAKPVAAPEKPEGGQ